MSKSRHPIRVRTLEPEDRHILIFSQDSLSNLDLTPGDTVDIGLMGPPIILVIYPHKEGYPVRKFRQSEIGIRIPPSIALSTGIADEGQAGTVVGESHITVRIDKDDHSTEELVQKDQSIESIRTPPTSSAYVTVPQAVGDSIRENADKISLDLASHQKSSNIVFSWDETNDQSGFPLHPSNVQLMTASTMTVTIPKPVVNLFQLSTGAVKCRYSQQSIHYVFPHQDMEPVEIK